MKLNIDPCVPPIWARSGHAQTILAHYLPSEMPRQSGIKLRIELGDGDILSARHFPGTSKFIVIFFHGLGGSVASTYIGRSTRVAQSLGHGVIAVNHRGCGDGRELARGPYHSGRGDDISEVIDFARTNFPGKSIITVGYSLGANALLTLLCGLRGSSQPDYAVAVNGPTDLAASTAALKRGWNRLYDLSFVQGCRREVHYKRDRGWIQLPHDIARFANLHDIDQVYTAPQGGFSSAEDYYATCSTFAHLAKIRTPTTILMSKDDPFIPWQPYLAAEKNPNVHLHLEETGGHMGYLARGLKGQPYRRWLDEALEEILRKITH